jgi:ribosomal protein S18 acetylase RimI-like enzyme
VTLRPAGADDEAFLRELYASTREDELALAPWSEEQRRDFLDFQFGAQKAHYEEHHPSAGHDVILYDRERAGRFYVDRSEREINVIDLALLPAFRGRGIGSALLGSVIDEARDDGREVLFFVEQSNRARALYERLGFELSGDLGVYLEMRWRPVQAGGADDAGELPASVCGD